MTLRAAWIATCFVCVPSPLSVGEPPNAATNFLSAATQADREFARRQLLLDGQATIPVFIAALASDDAALREAGLRSLGTLGVAADVDTRARIESALAEATCDSEPRVRAAALSARALMGAREFSIGLVAGARDEDWAVRRAAALALASCPDKRAIDPLIRLAGDADPDVRRAANDALLLRDDATVEMFLHDEFLFADEPLRRRIVEKLAESRSPGFEGFLENVLLHCEDPFETAAAALGLAKRGVDLSIHPGSAVVIRGALANEPYVHRLAYLAMLPKRAEFAKRLLELLTSATTTDPAALDAAAHLVVDLVGLEAFEPLLALATGEASSRTPARVAAVSALRRYRAEHTPRELAWVYAPELPRLLREGLLSAFEDQPFTVGARSGLIQALSDPDSGIRIRAFAALLRYGAEDDVEMSSLLRRIGNERDGEVRGRMTRLVAEHARGDGARTFVATYLPRVLQSDALRREAIDALENLPESGLSHEAAAQLLREAKGPLDPPLLRLLTRLRGDAADKAVANAIVAAREHRDIVALEELVLALRHGGGDLSLSALERLLDDADAALALEALRTLLRHDRPAAIKMLDAKFQDLDPDLRGELIETLDAAEIGLVSSLYRRALSTTTDIPTRLVLLVRAGELRLPLEDVLSHLLAHDPMLEMRLRAGEALAAIGGAQARERLLVAFDVSVAALDFEAADAADLCSSIESLAKSLARVGATEHLDTVATTIFSRYRTDSTSPSLRVPYDAIGGFAFEETLLAALLEAGSVADASAAAAKALFDTLEHLESTGDLARVPDDLLLRLGDAVAVGGDEFLPIRERFYSAALAVPPTIDRREVKSALDLADVCSRLGDEAAAASWLALATRAIDVLRIDRAERSVVVTYGPARAVTGFEPLRRLRARAAVARARDAERRGDATMLREALRDASRFAPDDASLAVDLATLGAAVVEVSLLRRELENVVSRVPTQADLLARVTEISARLGERALVEISHVAVDSLTRCGLAEDSGARRLRLARARAAIGDLAIARAELHRALEIDPSLGGVVRDDAVLAPLLTR
jgi:HEAT repeat protein/tetratricopeptide (TPR) repeat protein